MKINKIIYLVIVSFLLVFSACEPIVEEQNLVNTTDVAGVQLLATQSTPGGNEITIDMITPGITGYWDYNLGLAFTNKIKFIYPIPGKATFKYTGSLGAEFFKKSIDVQIDKLDHPLDQDWYDLVSTATSAGKTWVFDGGPNPDGKKWWFMSAPNNPDGALNPWWNAGGECCPPTDAAGKMKFNLDGAANYYHYESQNATPTKGSFVLDVKNQKLIIGNSKILGYDRGGDAAGGVFTIISLTADKMVLYNPNSASTGTGWTLVYKVQP